MTDQSPTSKRDMQEFVKATMPTMKRVNADHKYGWHDGYPRAGCPSCLFRGATWPDREADAL